jgi:hypothetical protein
MAIDTKLAALTPDGPEDALAKLKHKMIADKEAKQKLLAGSEDKKAK